MAIAGAEEVNVLSPKKQRENSSNQIYLPAGEVPEHLKELFDKSVSEASLSGEIVEKVKGTARETR